MSHSDIGLIGLGVMGQNLAMNMNDHGFVVSVYNRTLSRTRAFIHGLAKGTTIIASDSLSDLVSSLTPPRKILLMVKAGKAVDALIEQLQPLLEVGDIILDGGNSHYVDSNRRVGELAEKGLRFVGCGISGGEDGARFGPSIMPGGERSAWPEIKPLLQVIAAEVDGVPCCQWIGEGGSGHYVKMVHNGIEYGDMQLITEVYQLMRDGLGMDVDAIQAQFAQWNKGVLESYLIEITAEILGVKDEDGLPLIDKILDVAGQKGTGKWTGISALELGAPVTMISEAVFARFLSSYKDQRVRAQARFASSAQQFTGDMGAVLGNIQHALYAAKIISYAQGFMLMREASEQRAWDLNYGDIALTWRGGCIIRSRFLDDINTAFSNDPKLPNLLFDEFFIDAMRESDSGWRKTAALGIELKLPLPALTSALAFYDGFRCARLPAGLLQAQRDYFGAHRYERVDRPRGEFFHSSWKNAVK